MLNEPTPTAHRVPVTRPASFPSQAYPSLFLPLAIVVVTLFVWAGFQTVQLVRERTALHTLKANQEPTIQEAAKVRAQLDSIAGRMAVLASQGNAGARVIVEELRRRGITVNVPAPAAPAPESSSGPAK